MGFGKDGKGVMIRHHDNNDALGTLGALTALKSNALTMGEDFRMIKLEVLPNLQGLTANEGPIMFGIADNALTVAQIAEALGASGPVDRNDNVSDERAHRFVKLLCQFPFGATSEDTPVNHGRPIEATIRWTFSDPEGWCFFYFNASAGALQTGAVGRHQATIYGVWVT